LFASHRLATDSLNMEISISVFGFTLKLNRWECLIPTGSIRYTDRDKSRIQHDMKKVGSACARVISPDYELVRLQEYGQSDGGGDDTGQELAGSKAKGAAAVTLSAPRGTGRSRRGRRRGSRALGGSRGGRQGGRCGGTGRGGPNWERAGIVDLLLNIGREVSAHSSQLELGGEGQSGVLRLLGILEGKRFESDEIFLRVGSDGSIRAERERAGGGNVSGGGEQLEGGLLLRVSDVDGDLGGTKVLQRRSRIVGIFNPLNSLLLTGWPRGSGSGGGCEDGGESRGQGGGQSQQESDGTHYGGEVTKVGVRGSGWRLWKQLAR